MIFPRSYSSIEMYANKEGETRKAYDPVKEFTFAEVVRVDFLIFKCEDLNPTRTTFWIKVHTRLSKCLSILADQERCDSSKLTLCCWRNSIVDRYPDEQTDSKEVESSMRNSLSTDDQSWRMEKMKTEPEGCLVKVNETDTPAKMGRVFAVVTSDHPYLNRVQLRILQAGHSKRKRCTKCKTMRCEEYNVDRVNENTVRLQFTDLKVNSNSTHLILRSYVRLSKWWTKCRQKWSKTRKTMLLKAHRKK